MTMMTMAACSRRIEESSGYIDVCVCWGGGVWVGMREYERASCAYAVYRGWRVEVY